MKLTSIGMNIIISLSLIIFSLISFESNSQISLNNNSLLVPDSSIIYRGYPNFMEFDGINIDSTFKLKTKFFFNGINRNNFVLEEISTLNENRDTIILSKNDSIYFQKVFTIKNLPSPKFRIIGIKDSIIEKEILINNLGLEVFHNQEIYKPCVKISYINLLIIKGKDTLIIDRLTDADKIKYEKKRLKIDRKEYKWSTKKVMRKLKNLCIIDCPDANKFSKYQIEQIKKLNTGDIIFIDYIRSSPNRCYCIGRTFASDIKLIIK